MKVKHLPIRIQELVKRNADACGIKFNADKLVDSHFNIICNKDGDNFWKNIISGNFKPFYKKYGFDGEIKDYPYDVVMAMCDEQVKQGNKWSVEVFEEFVGSNNIDNGFLWGDTDEGLLFWKDVIVNKKFNLITSKMKFTREDLKTGMVVELRNGEVVKVMNDTHTHTGPFKNILAGNGYCIDINAYNPISLKFKDDRYPELDVVRVYRHSGQRHILSMDKGDLVWGISEVKEVTLQEIADVFDVNIKNLKIIDK